MAVVKANAYGHGAVECARRLEAEGADWFGVALPEEGVELRTAGITKPILCLAGFWKGQANLCLQQQLVPVVYRLDMIEAFDRAAGERGIVADVHLKVDTGMGRLGIRFDEIAEFASGLKRFENIRVDGLMTHFAAADEPSCGPLTHDQITRFDNALAAFANVGFIRLITISQILRESLDSLHPGETSCGPVACCMDCGATSSLPTTAR